MEAFLKAAMRVTCDPRKFAAYHDKLSLALMFHDD